MFEIRVPTGQLDLPLCVSSGQVFRWEELSDGRWFGVDGGNWYLVTVPPRRERELDSLSYVAERKVTRSGDELFQVETNGSEADFVSLFRLEWDAAAIEKEIVQRAPELEPYMGTLQGLRLMQPSDAVEMFFSFLCTPNNNVKRITSMVRHLAAYGPVFDEVLGTPVSRFPEPEDIAAIHPDDLWAKGFGYRARTIPNAAREVVSRGGRGWIEGLRQQPYEVAHQELVAISGIGPKLADCIALFALHQIEAVPVDTHVWQALTRLYFPEWKDKSVTDQRYKAASDLLREKLGPLTGWGHQYLFYDNLLNWRSRRK